MTNLKRIKRICKFYHRYYRVYIKYKHILPAVLGLSGKTYDPNDNKFHIDSNIFIRDYSKHKYDTYIIRANGLESLEYYEAIMEDIKKVFEILLLSRINSILNVGRPFLIPVLDYVDVKYSTTMVQCRRPSQQNFDVNSTIRN